MQLPRLNLKSVHSRCTARIRLDEGAAHTGGFNFGAWVLLIGMLYNPHTGEYANNRISRGTGIFNLLKWQPGIPSTLSINPKPNLDLRGHFVIKEITPGLTSALL